MKMIDADSEDISEIEVPPYVDFMLINQVKQTGIFKDTLGYVSDRKKFLGLFHSFLLTRESEAKIPMFGLIDYMRNCDCYTACIRPHVKYVRLALFLRLGGLLLTLVPPRIRISIS